MPAGMAQGIAIRKQYKGRPACLVEIDCRPQTVNRKIEPRVHGPAGDQGRGSPSTSACRSTRSG